MIQRSWLERVFAMKSLQLSLIALIVVVIVQLAMPYPVFADDATPPTPEMTGEVQPAGTEQPDAEVLPAETEQPALEVTPVEVEQPTEAIVTEDTPAAGTDIGENDQPGSILEALSDTDLVVLDENNQPIPLATEAAATAIANSDPWWCPGSESPATGGCSSYATFTDLLSGLQSLGSLTDGAIYIQEGDYTGAENKITLDGNSLTQVGNLTLIGGWDLALLPPTQTGATTFHIPLSITNWLHSVSIQDISIQSAYGSGLTVDAAGSVTLTNVDTSLNWDDNLSTKGIDITSNSNVTLNHVSSASNTSDGIYIETNGDVVLNNVSSTDNAGDGIHIVTGGNVTLNDVNTLANYGTGIHIETGFNVTLNNVNSSYNAGDGITITPNASVTWSNVQSEQNNRGIYAGGGGSETISILGGENTDLGGNKDNAALCENKTLVTLQLPSSNSLMVYCPISGTLNVKEQTKKGLPAQLPGGMDFIAGLNVTLSQDGAPTQVITDSGYLKPSFVVPPDQAGKNLVVLYWDASANNWVELPAFGSESSISLSNSGTVSEGVQMLNNIGRIEVGVNFPGIFVLAVK
jgi:hypothetical protein